MYRLNYDVGPIRPPSEAFSVLIRMNRNCPWNQCAFCSIYKHARYERKPVDEVLADVRTAAANHPDPGWVRGVFLQDADPLTAPTDEIVEVLRAVRKHFPHLERITAYARARTVRRKRGDLPRLREAGLTRLHVGLETGYGPLLEKIRKGATPQIMIEAGQAAKAAGLEVSEYVMPGLGGRQWSRGHAIASAQVLNAIDPDFIRLRTLSLREGTPLCDSWRAGEFELPTDEEIVHEIRLFVETLDGIHSRVTSDHILNLLEDVEGQLPGDKPTMLARIDAFLSLPAREREVFTAGRRVGALRLLADMGDPAKLSQAEAAHAELAQQAAQAGQTLDECLHAIRMTFV